MKKYTKYLTGIPMKFKQVKDYVAKCTSRDIMPSVIAHNLDINVFSIYGREDVYRVNK